jgi:myo-inositol catabolism protein IolC
MIARILFFAAFFALLAPPPAAAQVKTLGIFQDWVAYQTSQGGKRICYIASTPKKDEGNYSKRGDILTVVTHRPASKSFNVVSIHAGYKFKKGSTADVAIGGARFTLFTNAQTAWANDTADDKALVKNMRAGAKMIVRAKSWRGTETKDTYSLLGFTAAIRAINKACKAP